MNNRATATVAPRRAYQEGKWMNMSTARTQGRHILLGLLAFLVLDGPAADASDCRPAPACDRALEVRVQNCSSASIPLVKAWPVHRLVAHTVPVILGPIGVGDAAAYELGLVRQADDAHVEVCLPSALGYSLLAVSSEQAPGGVLRSVLIRLWVGGGGVQGSVTLTYRNGYLTTRVLERSSVCASFTIVQHEVTMGLFKGIDANAKDPAAPGPFNHIKLRNETGRPVKKLKAINKQVPAEVHEVQNLAANTPPPSYPYPTNFVKSTSGGREKGYSADITLCFDNTGQSVAWNTWTAIVTVAPAEGISHIRFVVAGPNPPENVAGVIVLGVDLTGAPGGGPDGILDAVPLNSGTGGNIVWTNTGSPNCP